MEIRNFYGLLGLEKECEEMKIVEKKSREVRRAMVRNANTRLLEEKSQTPSAKAPREETSESPPPPARSEPESRPREPSPKKKKPDKGKRKAGTSPYDQPKKVKRKVSPHDDEKRAEKKAKSRDSTKALPPLDLDLDPEPPGPSPHELLKQIRESAKLSTKKPTVNFLNTQSKLYHSTNALEKRIDAFRANPERKDDVRAGEDRKVSQHSHFQQEEGGDSSDSDKAFLVIFPRTDPGKKLIFFPKFFVSVLRRRKNEKFLAPRLWKKLIIFFREK